MLKQILLEKNMPDNILHPNNALQSCIENIRNRSQWILETYYREDPRLPFATVLDERRLYMSVLDSLVEEYKRLRSE